MPHIPTESCPFLLLATSQPIKSAASGQIDLQLTNVTKIVRSANGTQFPFCRFDKRFQGVATISASK